MTLGYTSDIEGDWQYWNRYLDHSNVLYKVGHLLELKENCAFVYGGDVCDRGNGDLRVLQDLIELKERRPDRVYFILGNRDINKLRLPFTLHHSVVANCDPTVYWSRTEGDRATARKEVTKGCQASKLKWVCATLFHEDNLSELYCAGAEQDHGRTACV